MAKPVQYIVANKGLNMSPGKLSAQVAHAAVKGYEQTLCAELQERSDERSLITQWNETGHTKIVLEARDTEHLLMVERYLKERGIPTVLIIDEGRTEIDPHTPTALASGIVDKDDPNIQMGFGDLKTYRDRSPEVQPSRLYRYLAKGS